MPTVVHDPTVRPVAPGPPRPDMPGPTGLGPAEAVAVHEAPPTPRRSEPALERPAAPQIALEAPPSGGTERNRTVMWLLITGAAVVVAVVFAAFVLPRLGGGDFTIESDAFAADTACTGSGTYAIDSDGDAVAAGDVDVQMVEDGMPSLWCVGLTHRFTSEISHGGYTFDSDTDDPLEFTIQEDGFVYSGGSGTVSTPEGDTVTLP